MRFRSLVGPLLVLIVSYALFEFLRRNPSFDVELAMPVGHFYMVSSVSLLSLFLAIAMGFAGVQLRNIKVSFLALSFISLSGIFAVHGLSTPNLILHSTHLPGITSPLSVLVASIWLWLSAFPSDHPLVNLIARYDRTLPLIWTIVVIGVGVYSMLQPHWVAWIPLDVHPFNWVVALFTALLNLIVMYRYYRSYLYSRFPLQISIVYSSGLLLVSQFIIVQGTPWKLSWWTYHYLLLFSMIIMLVGLYRQYAANRSLVGAIRLLFTKDPVELITNSIPPSVKALMIATESRDKYTAGHSLRVTLYALKLAEEMALRPDQLRMVAQGTIVHDVGKIDVPDAILNKPGLLSPEERSVIEYHPVKGYEMCRMLGFRKEELGIIRWHHEKWDGTGYPDHLKGADIPLLARIVAVADVYDALTSTRAYRQALSHQEAMTYIQQQSDIHFDPKCVKAWIRCCGREDGAIYPLLGEAGFVN